MRAGNNLKKNFLRGFAIAILIVLSVILTNLDSRANAADKKVSLGKKFEISLKANHTTGFRWEASYDKKFLKLVNETYRRDPTKSKTHVGVGGISTFAFQPLKPGETSIKFRYKRPWEKQIAEKRTYLITIVK